MFSLCDPLYGTQKVSGRVYLQNPIITLIREMVTDRAYPDVASAATHIRSTRFLHGVNIDRLTRDNYAPLTDVGKVYSAIANRDPWYAVVVSEITDYDWYSVQNSPTPEDCLICNPRTPMCHACRYGTETILTVSSNLDRTTQPEIELVRSMMTDFSHLVHDDFLSIDDGRIEHIEEFLHRTNYNVSVPQIVGIATSMFNDLHYENLVISFSVVGEVS